MIHIYTGDGKGKTTAATGLTVRALGAGLRVFFAQFIKDGSSSEIQFLKEHCTKGFTYFTCGSGKFITGTPSREECRRAEDTLAALKRSVVSGEYDLVVADEILGSLCGKLLALTQVMSLIEEAKEHPEVELILTGRNAPPELIECADLVSNIQCIKHYFTQKRAAKRGIEF